MVLLLLTVPLHVMAQDVTLPPAVQFVVDAYNTGDTDAVAAYLANDYTWHENANIDHTGTEGFVNFISRVRTFFPDIQLRVEDAIQQDDRVAIRYSITGTHTGSIGGVAATGNDLLLTGSLIFRFNSSGRVGEVWNLFDTVPLLQALGELPSDATVSPMLPIELAGGEFNLPAANAFGEPGFHTAFTLTARVPDDLGTTAGAQIVVSLRDASRPQQTCNAHHPLSGCATVDWSDFEGRPNVPAGGVFDNRLTLQLESGERSFFLSQTGVLADVPDAFSPG